MTTSVLVVDDQELARAGLGMILDATDDLRVAGQAADGLEAVAVARTLSPDVVLMDIRMPRARRHRGDAPDRHGTTAASACSC